MSVPTASLQPYIRQAAGHQRLAYTGGAELAVILDAAITGGQLTVIESHSRRGDASPVHVHGRDDEAFLLLDGAMTVWVGESRHQLWPGGIAFLPRGIPHAVRCDIASRALVLTNPAGSPGDCLPGGRLGPEPAPARGLAAHPGCGPPRRGTGRKHDDRSPARDR